MNSSLFVNSKILQLRRFIWFVSRLSSVIQSFVMYLQLFMFIVLQL